MLKSDAGNERYVGAETPPGAKPNRWPLRAARLSHRVDCLNLFMGNQWAEMD